MGTSIGMGTSMGAGSDRVSRTGAESWLPDVNLIAWTCAGLTSGGAFGD